MPQRQSSRLKAHDSDNPVGGACDVMRHAFLRWTVRALTHMRLFVGVRSLSRASRSEQVRLRHRHANTTNSAPLRYLTPKNGARYVIVQTGFALAHTLAVLPAPRFFVT